MKPVDRNAPIHSVEVVIPQEFLARGGNIATLPDKISPSMFDQFFAQNRIITGSEQDLMRSSASEYSNNSNQSQLPGYSKMPNNYDPMVAQKLGKVPPIPKDQKRVAGYDDAKTGQEKDREERKRKSKNDNTTKPSNSKNTKNTTKDKTGPQSKNARKQKISSRTSESSTHSLTYSTESETISASSGSYSHSNSSSKTYSDSRTGSTYTDSYSQDYEEVRYDKNGERIRKKDKPDGNPKRKNRR